MNTDLDKQFEGRQAAAAFLNTRFSGCAALGDQELATLADAFNLVRETEVTPQRPPGAAPALSKVLRYVVRNDDLNLFDAIIDALKTSVSAGFFIAADFKSPAVWTAITALITGIGKVARNAVHKGKLIDPRSLQILFSLKQLGETSESQLFETLRSKNKDWNEGELSSILTELGRTRMNDHSVRELVYRSASGNWRIGNI